MSYHNEIMAYYAQNSENIYTLPSHYQVMHCIADCCSGCSSVRSSTFATFKSSSKMVSEDTALVHIDVYRYGPMERPLTLRVIDEPGTALKGRIVTFLVVLYCKINRPTI